MPLVKCMLASSEQACEPMAPSSIDFCRKRAPYLIAVYIPIPLQQLEVL
jgi:hypothetical protein